MIDSDGARRRGAIAAILAGAFALPVAAGILLWSWNRLGAGLFSGRAP